MINLLDLPGEVLGEIVKHLTWNDVDEKLIKVSVHCMRIAEAEIQRRHRIRRALEHELRMLAIRHLQLIKKVREDSLFSWLETKIYPILSSDEARDDYRVICETHERCFAERRVFTLEDPKLLMASSDAFQTLLGYFSYLSGDSSFDHLARRVRNLVWIERALQSAYPAPSDTLTREDLWLKLMEDFQLDLGPCPDNGFADGRPRPTTILKFARDFSQFVGDDVENWHRDLRVVVTCHGLTDDTDFE